jgi:hypothetical protein
MNAHQCRNDGPVADTDVSGQHTVVAEYDGVPHDGVVGDVGTDHQVAVVRQWP